MASGYAVPVASIGEEIARLVEQPRIEKLVFDWVANDFDIAFKVFSRRRNTSKASEPAGGVLTAIEDPIALHFLHSGFLLDNSCHKHHTILQNKSIPRDLVK